MIEANSDALNCIFYEENGHLFECLKKLAFFVVAFAENNYDQGMSPTDLPWPMDDIANFVSRTQALSANKANASLLRISVTDSQEFGVPSASSWRTSTIQQQQRREG
jgi:hypothetical protein